MSGERIGNSNQFLSISGVVSAPAYSWASDNDSGMYRIGANNIGFSVNGTKILDVGTTGLSVTGTGSFTSTATATALIPSGSGVPTNGVYLPAANTVGFAINSAETMRLGSDGSLLIGTTTNAGAGNVSASGFNSVTGTIATTSGVAVTVSSSSAATAVVKVWYGITGHAVSAIVCTFGGNQSGVVVQGVNTASTFTITTSGTNIQFTQTSGSNFTVSYAITYLTTGQ